LVASTAVDDRAVYGEEGLLPSADEAAAVLVEVT
jgi:hypothetical protein